MAASRDLASPRLNSAPDAAPDASLGAAALNSFGGGPAALATVGAGGLAGGGAPTTSGAGPAEGSAAGAFMATDIPGAGVVAAALARACALSPSSPPNPLPRTRTTAMPTAATRKNVPEPSARKMSALLFAWVAAGPLSRLGGGCE